MPPNFPYPGALTETERINLQRLQLTDYFTPIWIEFSIKELNKARITTILPKDAVIVSPAHVRIEEAFDGIDTYVRLDLLGVTPSDVLTARVNNAGIVDANFNQETDSYFLRRLAEEYVLVVSVGYEGNTAPTYGKGWILLTYIDLGRFNRL